MEDSIQELEKKLNDRVVDAVNNNTLGNIRI